MAVYLTSQLLSALPPIVLNTTPLNNVNKYQKSKKYPPILEHLAKRVWAASLSDGSAWWTQASMSPTYLRGSWAWSSIGLGAPPGPPMVRASRKPRTSHPLLTTTHSSTTRLLRSSHLECVSGMSLTQKEWFSVFSYTIRDLFSVCINQTYKNLESK